MTVAEKLREVGVQVRAGIHCGECEAVGEDLAGLAVHIGARVGALARPSEVLVSGTVCDLRRGSMATLYESRSDQSLSLRSEEEVAELAAA